MAGTVLGNTVEFLAHIGIYDIVLPFLLVFTLMFAFLEKTRVLGVEVISDSSGNEHTFTRKNLNSIVAFTVAFFVIASSQLVRIISEVLANTIILVVAGLSFMLASGVIYQGDEPMQLSGKWEKGYKIFSLVGIVLILFNALGWLDKIYAFLVSNWNNGHVATVIMIGLFIWFMYWITTPKGSGKKSEDSDD
ncbi:MAG: hypothetical protein ACLFTH_01155 [Candidatus Woesearchaeota archaeon]